MESNNFKQFQNKSIVKKEELTRIEICKLPKKPPEFRRTNYTKEIVLSRWLANWILADLETGKIKPNQLLPKKERIARYLRISTGTVQNAIRYIEDAGLVESKQRIGTVIKDPNSEINIMRKLRSKRDKAILDIKCLILNLGTKPGEKLPSSREFAEGIGCSPNTTRVALEYLAAFGVIENLQKCRNKAHWILKEIPVITEQEKLMEIKTSTLVEQIKDDLKNYIENNFSAGQKLPSHKALSLTLKVSMKTVHDAIRQLTKEGILDSKRGYYGTIVICKPSEVGISRPENDIFAPATTAFEYNYEKVEQSIKHLIIENYKVGDKLPAMQELSKTFDVSGNTIRKALQNLAKQCIVEFTRGKYGGTFIVNMPKADTNKTTFTWLSVNKDEIHADKSELIN